MKKKNIIVLTSMSMIALSSGFFGITKVGNFSYFTKAQNEIGTFTLSNEENVFSQGNKEYEITSNRNTKGQASLITWGTAEFTNKEDAFCHLYANDEDEAWINIEAKGISSISWVFDIDVNVTCTFLLKQVDSIWKILK